MISYALICAKTTLSTSYILLGMDTLTKQANWADWKRLLSLSRASVGLRAMQEAGVLSNALPEWRNIECLVVRDFYHRYTVDEHTLVAHGGSAVRDVFS